MPQPRMKCKWIDPQAKAGLNVDNEYFLGVKWFRTVPMEEGYWERGMVSLPMVAYLMNDESTHNKVLKHFHITLR